MRGLRDVQWVRASDVVYLPSPCVNRLFTVAIATWLGKNRILQNPFPQVSGSRASLLLYPL